MKLLQNKTNVEAPSIAWPFGNLKNDTGAGDGTPVDKELITDIQQTFEKIFDESGLTANGLPDNASNGFQLYEALRTLFPVKKKVVEIGVWNMDSTMTVYVAHGLDPLKIRTVSIVIISDANTLYPFESAYNSLSGSWAIDLTGANVELVRPSSGFFDQSLFDDGTINRGFITIGYVD